MLTLVYIPLCMISFECPHVHMQVIGTRVEFDGNVLFYGNGGSGFDGGSVYLTSFAQIEVFAGAKIDFVNNSGV